MRFEGRAASHVGAVREHNEDAAFFACAGGTALAIVADGCGGLCSGRVAADLAIEVVRDAFRNPLPALSATWWRGEHGTALPATERAGIERHVAALLESHRVSTPGDVAVLNDGLADLLASAIACASETIHRVSTRTKAHRGMGASLVAAVFTTEHVVVGHVGDARLYRLRGGHLAQLTADHSLVNEYIRQGLLADPAEVAAFEHRDVIFRALGTTSGVAAELAKHVPELDDASLLLSDGVFKTLDEGAIERLVHEHGAEAGPALVEAGRRRAQDNLSAVVVKVAA